MTADGTQAASRTKPGEVGDSALITKHATTPRTKASAWTDLPSDLAGRGTGPAQRSPEEGSVPHPRHRSRGGSTLGTAALKGWLWPRAARPLLHSSDTRRLRSLSQRSGTTPSPPHERTFTRLLANHPGSCTEPEADPPRGTCM
eukprot:scaffold2639_cov385-Prasinococcus_capsulatus_cf.AAC.6